jgi:hypothetical protein
LKASQSELALKFQPVSKANARKTLKLNNKSRAGGKRVSATRTGRKNGRTNGRTNGIKNGRMKGREKGRKEGRKKGRKEERKKGRKEERKKERKEERKKKEEAALPAHVLTRSRARNPRPRAPVLAAGGTWLLHPFRFLEFYDFSGIRTNLPMLGDYCAANIIPRHLYTHSCSVVRISSYLSLRPMFI